MAEAEPLRNEKGQFQKGTIGIGGRKLGSRHKLGEAFTEALCADFQQHGVAAIERVRNEEPASYVRVIAGLLPKEMKIDSAPLSDLSDDELSRLIDILRTAIGSPGGVGGGKQEAPRPSITH